MIRFNASAGVAALVVSLVSVFAPVEAPHALAQQAPALAAAEHTQPAAEEVVPQFIAKAVVQTVPEEGTDASNDLDDAGSLRELVGRMDGDSQLDEQMKCLAGAVYFEARGEPLAGQLAVAEVIVNRAASSRFPASYCGVVLQRSQFSFVKHGHMPAIPAGAATWQRAKAIAQIAHRGLWDSEAEGSLYFHARSVAPAWSNHHQAMARISGHVFYK